MNAKQENKFSMAKSVLKTLEDNTTVVNSLTALAASKAELDSIISQIDTLTQAQGQKTSAKEKTLAAETAITVVLEVINAAKAYALDQQKPSVAASFNYPKRELKRMRDTVLCNTLQLIKDNASLLPDLANFGADAAKLTELQTATDAYKALLTVPKTNLAAKSTATKGLSTAFEKLDAVIEKVDMMVETKRNSHKDFYNTYHVVRKVENRHGKSKGEDVEKGNEGNTPTPPQK